ncbi:hypothetical protein KIL84_019715 [Mauremys mutica]|uniref:DUF4371 domain-containing protein n=1 Tax=Mauremys mutica TaxID=74926 RepID=A0A9D3XWX2_9SAUR|nr:hypothetical protein KIL84_019715 [Mauremys mutica]
MDHYCSKTIQNKLVDLMAKKVLDNILMWLRKAKYYAILMDCTPDISQSEKMLFTVRFVDDKDGCIQVKEHFICFQSLDNSTGTGLTEQFMNALNENKMKRQDCCSQGYDNCANMKVAFFYDDKEGSSKLLVVGFMWDKCNTTNSHENDFFESHELMTLKY